MTKYIILEDCPLGKKGEEVETDFDGHLRQGNIPCFTNALDIFFFLKLGVIAVKDETPKRWRPEENTQYWYFDGDDGVTYCDEWKEDTVDLRRLAFGNVFKTKQEAEAKALEVKKVLLQ